MPGETRTLLRGWPIVVGAFCLLSGLVPATVAADTSGSLRERASQLAQQNADLAGRSRSTLLDLYALDSRLAQERARLVALRIRTAEVRAERAAAERRLSIVRHSLAAVQRLLALRLRDLYEQGDTDSLAVLLGATSVDDAIDNLDALNRTADQDRIVIAQTKAARKKLVSVTRALASREHELQSLAEEASQSTLALEQARSERASYLARLSTQRRLNLSTIASLEQQAQAVEARTRQLAALSAAGARTDYGGIPATLGGHTMTVVATGYSLGGHTATGTPVGWGVVAVDPSVIPLGTRLTVPGYGGGVAADTGSSVQGATIDLWFPTQAQARTWGRRTVAITLH